jgi:predicted anti-sigma-YlaC factor YlaD
MINETCDKIRPSLVDYSDGELPAGQARQISDHLSQCPACREELRLLERSLDLARKVWLEADSSVPLLASQQCNSHNHQQLLWIGGGLAVCAVIVLGLFLQTFFMRSKSIDANPQTIASAGSNSAQPKEEIDVMEYIAREGRSARLAASVELLAAQPGLEQYKEKTERYLKETYPETTAVQMLGKQ